MLSLAYLASEAINPEKLVVFSKTAYSHARDLVTGKTTVKQEAKGFSNAVKDFCKNEPVRAIILGASLTVLALQAIAYYNKKRIRKNTILELDLTDIVICEQPPRESLLAAVYPGPRHVWYRDIVEALEVAAEDNKVKGLICNIGTDGVDSMNLAHVEEIRNAIIKFGAKGKQTAVFAETIGYLENGMKAYFFATAFERILLSPIGRVTIPGLAIAEPFVKNTLDKLGVEVLFEQRENYKTAANLFTQSQYTQYHKEQDTLLLQGIMTVIKREFVARRTKGSMSEERVNEIFNTASYSSTNAVQNLLIDEVCHHDEIFGKISAMCGMESKDATFLFTSAYLSKVGRPHKETGAILRNTKADIALILAEGNIVDGEDHASNQGPAIYSYTLARLIRVAAKNTDTKAIILRVTSGGGSVTASDFIRRELLHAKHVKGKKIIISMGAAAASGGYWISTPADRIVCDELCMTGSIGVLGGKMNVRETLNKVGITFDSVESHEKSTMFSPVHGYKPEEKELSVGIFDQIYDEFLKIVETSRGEKIKTKAREKAQGQVFLGFQALEHGLVDEIGDLSAAIEATKKILGLKPEDKVNITVYPKKSGILSALLQQPCENSEQFDNAKVTSALPHVAPGMSLFQRVSALGSIVSSLNGSSAFASTLSGLLYHPTISTAMQMARYGKLQPNGDVSFPPLVLAPATSIQ